MSGFLATKAVEKSTYVITIEFTDESGDPVTPNTVTWTLSDVYGAIINSREDVTLTPTATGTIVLSGDDLVVTNYSVERVLTVAGTYDSTYGSDLPFKDSVRFDLDNLVVVT